MFLFLTVTFIMGVMRVADEYGDAIDAARDTARTNAVTADANAIGTICGAVMVAAGIADAYGEQLSSGRLDVANLSQIMADKLKYPPNVRAYLLVGPEGKLITYAGNFPADRNINVFEEMPTLRPPPDVRPRFVGKPFKGFDKDNPELWFLPLGVRVDNGGAKPAGFVIAMVDIRLFQEFYRSISTNQGGHIGLWTASGYLIAASPNAAAPVGTFDPAAQERYTTDAEALGVGEIRVSGPSAGGEINASARVGNLPLMISVDLPDANYMRAWRSMRSRMALAGIGVVLATTAFAGIILSQMQRTRRNEEALRNAKAIAEEANDAKSRFLAHMSHEFRTPLNAIMGFSDIIQNKAMGDPLAPVYVTYANHIYRSGEHLLEIVNEILDMAKIESGIQSLQQEVIDLTAVVESAVSFLERMASASHLKVKTEITARIPSFIGDERFVRQVLINLLSNAIKFSPAGSTVIVRAAIASDQALDLSVTDHGPGIEPMILKRIGEPFLQGNPTLSRAGQGTGLGLSICKHYMDLLGGALVIDSTLGAGTTVTMRFPRNLWKDGDP